VAVVVGGWAFAGWQNRPALVNSQPTVFALAIIASCLACWWFGRRSGRAVAVAVATARAEARATATATAGARASNQVVVNVQAGGRAQALRDFGGLERAPWIGQPVALLEQDTAQMSAEETYSGELDGEEVAVREVE
jgi:hypothetical protein